MRNLPPAGDAPPTSPAPTEKQPLTAQEKQARKAQQALDDAAAWVEYKDRETATRDRTAELRAERLEREAKQPAPKDEER